MTTTCAKDGCFLPTSGKSKYCEIDKIVARAAWKAMVADKGAARDERVAGHQDLFNRAVAAGKAAGEAAEVVPMVVIQRKHMMGDLLGMSEEDNPIVKAEKVDAGVCGFAWVKVTPGNSSFALWLVKNEYGRKSYGGGVAVYVHDYEQSMTRKLEHARAFAGVLQEAGLTAYPMSRMD